MHGRGEGGGYRKETEGKGQEWKEMEGGTGGGNRKEVDALLTDACDRRKTNGANDDGAGDVIRQRLIRKMARKASGKFKKMQQQHARTV